MSVAVSVVSWKCLSCGRTVRPVRSAAGVAICPKCCGDVAPVEARTMPTPRPVATGDRWRGGESMRRGAVIAIPSQMSAQRRLLGPLDESVPAARQRSRRWAHSPWLWSCAPGGLILLVIASVILVNASAGRGRAVDAAQVTSGGSVRQLARPGGAIDLMPLIDPMRDAVGGRWARTPAGLLSDSSKWAKLRIRYQPADEYDFRVEFTACGNEDVAQLFTAHGHACAWLMGAFKGSVCGLHYVRGKPANMNPTAVRDYTMTSGERHLSVLEVRKRSVAAYLDGKLLMRYETDGADLSTKSNWDVGEGSLGIGSYLNSTVFHKVELLERSERR